ncbi:NADH-quinone oxidoreductase subunit N [Bacteroidia bacterium]|nr:NADH-quinone oxidoreductase subunit N [Bacteroidia bacterium]
MMSVFNDFLLLRQEIGLVAILLILLLADILAPAASGRGWLSPLAYLLLAAQTVLGFLPLPAGEVFGGLYVTSATTVWMKNILNIGTLLVLLQAHKWLAGNDTVHKRGEFYVITLATLLGMYIMISAGNFMMLYIGIETASLPMACLVAFDKYKEKSAEAGVKYILTAAFSSAIMLFGISYLYGTANTLYFGDMQSLITNTPMAILGLVFFMTGLAFKLSLVPFHLWTADVYEGAPTSVTAYLSVVSKGAAAFALLFALWKVFGNIDPVWHYILWGLSVVTITVGNLFAIRQKDIKRFFAFSSISQAGYIVLGIMSGSAQGMTATMYYVLVYIFSNLAAFGVISAVENSSGQTSIASYNGLYKTNPLLSFVMMLAVFSLAGIPPFGGFFSKFFIFSAAAAQGEYLLVFIALLNTVISLYYYLLIVRAMFINPQGETSVGLVHTNGFHRTSIVLCVAGIIAVGILSAVYEFLGTVSFGM